MGGVEREAIGCGSRWRGLQRAAAVASGFQWKKVETWFNRIPYLLEGEVEICSVGLPISYSRDEGKTRTPVRNRYGTNGMLDVWLRKRPDSRLMSLSRSRSSLAGGVGDGGVPHPWTRGPLALPALSWWGRILTMGMATTVTVVSMAAFMAVAAMRAVAGSSEDKKGASLSRTPRCFRRSVTYHANP